MRIRMSGAAEHDDMKTPLYPLFDSLEYLHQNHQNVKLPDPRFENDFHYSLKFLQCYTGSLGTFNSYRRETERLLQWCWHIQQTTIPSLQREDIEQYLNFCQNPPKTWISIQKTSRYIEQEGRRQPNPAWRPFVVTISKAARKRGSTPAIEEFCL